MLAEAAEAEDEHSQCPLVLRQLQDHDDLSPTSRRKPHLFQKNSEKVMHDFYTAFFNSHVHLPPCHLPQDGCVIPVLRSEIGHAGEDSPHAAFRSASFHLS
ncbi:unnamed protein product [Heligmosomoides polygyrus]|uniref:Uncharacterized protein n=1 Tax=Heligmosomoides polygyrus TaxID=6339 RepID=A0A183G6X3_HELPZ|nr:unnamed protein product [Heligmosomoides polygyrus]